MDLGSADKDFSRFSPCIVKTVLKCAHALLMTHFHIF